MVRNFDYWLLRRFDGLVSFIWTWTGVDRSKQMNLMAAMLIGYHVVSMTTAIMSPESDILASAWGSAISWFLLAFVVSIVAGWRWFQHKLEQSIPPDKFNGYRIFKREKGISIGFRFAHLAFVVVMVTTGSGWMVVSKIASAEIDADLLSYACSALATLFSWTFWHHDVVLAPMGPRKKIKLPKLSMPRLEMPVLQPAPISVGAR